MPSHDPLDSLYWRDEILQIMFWYRGEGFGEAVAPADLLTFLRLDEPIARGHLEQMVAEGYVAPAPGGRYALTELGVREGGRRFADEFAGLTNQAHGECNHPGCDCKTLGPAACLGHPHPEPSPS